MNVVSRLHLPAGTWDGFVAAHPRGSFWHTEHWVEYCLRYTPGSRDHSVAVLDPGHRVIGVVPLIREARAFSMGGLGCPVPLLADDALWPSISRFVRSMAVAVDVGVWTMRGYEADTCPTGAEPEHWPSYIVDVSTNAAEMWSQLRRSYHALIHKAERNYELRVSSNPADMVLAQRVHAAAAGRETRPQSTWDIMGEWCGHGLGLLALAAAIDDPDDVRGMAFAIRYKDWAYYASGATLNDNVSHALIWKLMLALHCRDVRAFEIGWGERDGDTPKEKGIAFFKRGFGGTTCRVFRIEEPV